MVIPGMIVYVLASVTKIVRLANNWKDCERVKSLVNDLIVTCDEIWDPTESVPIKMKWIDEVSYWLIAAVLLVPARLLLLAVIVIEYYLKCGLGISCFLSY